MNSPRPATTPTTAALAPSRARYGPAILRAASYVMSPNRLTAPRRRTKLRAAFFLRFIRTYAREME